jgi:hypothetical protein
LVKLLSNDNNLRELEHLGLIKLNPLKKEPKHDFYISESMLEILDKEYADYMNGKGKNFSREEVMAKYKR